MIVTNCLNRGLPIKAFRFKMETVTESEREQIALTRLLKENVSAKYFAKRQLVSKDVS